MASRKFRFVSPGVFLKEIDNSQLPGQAPGIGPVLIGRTRQGPAMKPYKVRSMAEFERVFGLPMPGNQGEDPWREGTDLLAESYLPYAAKAYLSADIDSPVTVVRLAGIAGDTAIAESDGEPGWKAENAWGLFFFKSGSSTTETINLNLAGVFYGTDSTFGIKLKGQSLSGSSDITAKTGEPVLFSSASNRLNVVLSSSAASEREVKFLASEIRKDFNTNPVNTNSQIMTPPVTTHAQNYWLGETFEETIRKFESSITGTSARAAVVLRLDADMGVFRSSRHGLTAGRSGWVIGQDTSNNVTNFSAADQPRLFRFLALQEGSEACRNLMIGIEDIKIPREGAVDPFGSFSVVVKKIYPTKIEEIERFDNCNLNPNSENFVAKQIGDQYFEWSTEEGRNKLYNANPNISEYIRVEMENRIAQAGPDNRATVPFGFLGPVVPHTISSGSIANSASLGSATNSWVQGDFLTGQHEQSASVSWPAFPLVVTASADQGYYSGITAYKLDYSAGKTTTVSDEINPSYVDNLRRASEWKKLVSDQDDGIANEAGSSHAFTFTMDEIVLVPSPAANVATGSITRASQVSRVAFVPGSRVNTVSTAADKLDTTGIADLHEFQITVPQNAGGSGNMITVRFFENAIADAGANIIHVRADDADNAATNLIAAVNGTADQAKARYGAGTGDSSSGISGLSATAGSSTTKVSLSSTSNDSSASQIIVTNVAGLVNQAAVEFTSPSASSFSAHIAAANGTQDALRPLTEIVKGFNLPLVGGFDGTNVREANPFNNRVIGTEANASNSYAYASVERAINLISDPEVVEHNLAALPGITNVKLTNKLIKTCESRADSLAIIDLPDVYIPPSQQECSDFSKRLGTTPETSAKDLVKRQLNSSYGATYYPWVKIRDTDNSRDVWVPPSVVALGVMAYTEQEESVWFSPAGFNRGGLNQGNAGIPVLQVSEQLLSRDRDTLYEANINPIASFVSEGLVIFGQKTLQSTQSALDRINVRRLLIFVKKEVSRISSNLLFEQNVRATWVRFTNEVVPFLEAVKTNFGLTDFRVILDETTTTPELVDRNILYAKILLKPARAIEFIAVDFVITNTGASFGD